MPVPNRAGDPARKPDMTRDASLDNWLKLPDTISPELQQKEAVDKWRNDKEKNWKAAKEAHAEKMNQEDEKYRKVREEKRASREGTVTSITGSGGTSYVSNLPGSREGGY